MLALDKLLDALISRGVRVRLEGDGIRFSNLRGLGEEVREALAHHKTELLRLLAQVDCAEKPKSRGGHAVASVNVGDQESHVEMVRLEDGTWHANRWFRA